MVKREKIDLSEERRILAYMIVNTDFLREMRDIARPELFEASATRLVCQWAFEYYDVSKEAPGRGIEDIFMRKKRSMRGDDDVDLVADYLGTLSKDWTRWAQTNMEYSVRNATEYFNLRALYDLKDRLEGALHHKDVLGATQLVGDFKKIERVQGDFVELYSDPEAVSKAFTETSEHLFQFAGPLGKMIGPISRGEFMAFQAPPKRGKSWWLMETAFRASQFNLKALFISLEMTKIQVTRRAWCRATGQTERNIDSVRMPRFEDGKVVVSEERVKQIDPDRDIIAKKQRSLKLSARGGDYRLAIHSSLSVSEVEAILDNLENYEGWNCDVLVIDYADLMRASNSRTETRHQLDEVWKGLRALAQRRNIAIVTASQGGIRKVDSDKQVGVSDIAEDARKIAHVTKLILLNQSTADKKSGIMRVRAPIQREGDGDTDGEVVVLQCLDIGRPYLASAWKHEVELPENAERKNSSAKL